MTTLFKIFAPFYSRLLGLIAYGPWSPPVHKLLIRGFKYIYGIEDPMLPSHRRLGDFFLRDKSIDAAPGALVSPAECSIFDGPRQIKLGEFLKVKGLHFEWNKFKEFQNLNSAGTEFWFWNMYLAPYHYHWVHSPADAESFEAMRVSGAHFPVNALGRKLSPQLYAENERLSFRWKHPELGWIYLLCVGAMGVAQLKSCVGEVAYGNWQRVSGELRKAQKIAGFQLGSTVLLFVEKNPGFRSLPDEIFVGHPLLETPSV